MSGSTILSDLAAPYVNGSSPADQPQTGLPLDRFLPPYYPGSISGWLQRFAPPGSLILDPFGQDPYVLLELARAGYRVVVSANNPIAAFILEVMASAPSAEEISEAVHILAGIRSAEGLSLEDQINAYYQFDCPNPECQQVDEKAKLQVDYLVWAENALEPELAFGSCPHCGKQAEYPLTPEMLASKEPLPPLSVLKARLLELSANPGDPLRDLMSEVIAFYPHRSLASLQTILSRLDNPIITPRQRTLLRALILSTADRVNQLWTHPGGRSRPRQLLRPPLFQELNPWQALLAAQKIWSKTEQAVPMRQWPALPPQMGGISIFRGRLRELDPPMAPGSVDVVITSLPRRNQAWWNLSGLWSSWLWGREGSATLRNSLLKQRYDWTWHSTALQKVLVQLGKLLRPGVPVLMQVTELDPMFTMAGILAAQNAGLTLHQLAANGDMTVLQSAWHFGRPNRQSGQNISFSQAVKKAGMQFLQRVGEPVTYLRLFCAVIVTLLTDGLLDGRPGPGETLNELQEEIDKALTEPGPFSRFNPGVSADSGLYWLVDASGSAQSAADRAERAILNALQSQPLLSMRDALNAVNLKLPGLQNVEMELVQAILESYADPTPDLKAWSLRSFETTREREKDLKTIFELIESLANRIRLAREIKTDSIIWLGQDGSPEFSFFPIITTEFSELLIRHQYLPGKKLIVLPGSRANLAAFKLRRDPHLQLLKTERWSIVKYRQLRNLSDNPLLTQELFASQITGDPPEYRSSQLALF
jgi:hypothetical protein